MYGGEGGMKRTMVYLKDEQFLLLKKIAASSKKRMSEIIREAMTQYLTEKKEEVDYMSFVGIAQGPEGGKISEQAEEILKELLK
jgi:FPC/CPF motif-containing protein YcgG